MNRLHGASTKPELSPHERRTYSVVLMMRNTIPILIREQGKPHWAKLAHHASGFSRVCHLRAMNRWLRTKYLELIYVYDDRPLQVRFSDSGTTSGTGSQFSKTTSFCVAVNGNGAPSNAIKIYRQVGFVLLNKNTGSYIIHQKLCYPRTAQSRLAWFTDS